jgi:hypothetical protein
MDGWIVWAKDRKEAMYPPPPEKTKANSPTRGEDIGHHEKSFKIRPQSMHAIDTIKIYREGTDNTGENCEAPREFR